MKQVKIICRGSSLGNGSGSARAGGAAILEYKGLQRLVAEFFGNHTNQQAAIRAATIGLKALKEPCEVTLMSCSKYLITAMISKELIAAQVRTEDRPKSADNKKNFELLQELEEAASRHKVTWIWIPSDSGDSLHEQCRTAARQVAKTGAVDLPALDPHA